MNQNLKSVYILSDRAGSHKIGVSTNPAARSIALQSRRRGKLAVVRIFEEGGNFRLIERVAHGLLAEYRSLGEWFDVSEQQAIDAVTTAVQMVESGNVPDDLPKGKHPSDGSTIAVRITSETKRALEQAAYKDRRTISGLVQLVIEEWLRNRPQPKLGKRL